MNILQIVAFGITVMLISNVVTGYNKAFKMYITLIATIIILVATLNQFGAVLELLKELGDKVGVQRTYLLIIFQVIGIAYITEFGQQLCKDGGEDAIAKKIEFAGKIIIFVVASPIILALMELITQLL